MVSNKPVSFCSYATCMAKINIKALPPHILTLKTRVIIVFSVVRLCLTKALGEYEGLIRGHLRDVETFQSVD